MNTATRQDFFIHYALEQRATIRFYNRFAAKGGPRAAEHKQWARRALRRACFYLDEVRIAREHAE